jgi:hypothetical protein
VIKKILFTMAMLLAVSNIYAAPVTFRWQLGAPNGLNAVGDTIYDVAKQTILIGGSPDDLSGGAIDVAGDATSYVFNSLPDNQIIWIGINATDTSGNVSATAPPIRYLKLTDNTPPNTQTHLTIIIN